MEFSKLPYDFVHNVLHYISLNERVQLERVNKTFKEIIDGLWHAQKSLAVTRLEKSIQWVWPPVCYMKRHTFHEIDIFIIKKDPKIEWTRILEKCKNVRSLSIEMDSSGFGGQLANVLNSNCSKLEHIDGACYDNEFLANFRPGKQFCCFLLFVRGREGYVDFFQANHPFQLMTLRCNDMPNSLQFLDQPKLEQIYFRGEWLESYDPLKGLKSLPSVCLNYADIKHLSLTQMDVYLSADMAQQLRHNKDLEQLHVTYHCEMSQKDHIKDISKYCPNLKWFNFFAYSDCPDDIMERLYDEASKLKQLRVLEIVDVFSDHHLEIRGLEKLMKNCEKLWKIEHYDGNHSYSDQEKRKILDLLEEYADLHPKRAMKIKWTKVFNDEATYDIPANVRIYL